MTRNDETRETEADLDAGIARADISRRSMLRGVFMGLGAASLPSWVLKSAVARAQFAEGAEIDRRDLRDDHPTALPRDPAADAFSFRERLTAASAVVMTSELVTIDGFYGPLAISISGGETAEYSIDDGAWTSAPSTIDAAKRSAFVTALP